MRLQFSNKVYLQLVWVKYLYIYIIFIFFLHRLPLRPVLFAVFSGPVQTQKAHIVWIILCFAINGI